MPKAKAIQAITLGRSGVPEYQVTYWNDGVARFDGSSGQRQGAWSATIPPSWFLRAAKVARDLEPGSRPKGSVSLTIVLDTLDGRTTFEASEPDEPSDLWVLSTLIDGMCTRTHWAPLDIEGGSDFLRFASGTPIWMSTSGATATAFGLDGSVLVLAGAQASTSTSASLEDHYQLQRTDLIDAGVLALQDDLFRLSRHLLFDSPSAAASVLAGSNTNGRRAWKDATGTAWAELDLDR